MQIYEYEVINLTFLNSVYVRYAIINNKVKGWRIGGQTVDFAYAIRYLNAALSYLDKREEQEAEILTVASMAKVIFYLRKFAKK